MTPLHVVIRATGQVRGIVEEGDADDEQRGIAEINTGILAARAGRLRGWLQNLSRDNAQGEHYLTDVVARAVEHGLSVRTVPPEAMEEVLGINDRVQLAALERFQQRRLAEGLMRAGASLADPVRVDNCDGARKHETVIGDNAFIGSGVMLVAPVTVHVGATIGAGSTIGKDAPADALTLARAPQRTFEGWKLSAQGLKKASPSRSLSFVDVPARMSGVLCHRFWP